MEARGQEPSLGIGSDALLFSFLIIEVGTVCFGKVLEE